MTLMVLIRRFDEIGRGDVDIAGGKGANLGELARGGFPVPPGFVLTTEAYRRFVDEVGIGAEILALAGGEGASEKIRALFTSSAVPADMAGEITAMAQMLGPTVAVRSSATAEDLEGASFAGQQDTYLNVRGPEALLAAVRDCWASLWTERALAYRARQGIAPASVALAVVVQRMVEAEVAGVMFTANPANGRRDEIVVSAAWGLGESVVSGSVTTDDLVVTQGRVRSRSTADKAVMTVYAGAGTRERPVPEEQRARAVLDDAAAVELAAIGARIEKHFGAPQDVEWAYAAGSFAIVQARPITALPEPEAAPPTDWTVPSGAYYFRASIVEQLPDPLSPLFADLVDGSVTRSVQALMREFAGEDVIRDGEIGLPTVNGYAYYRYAYGGLARMTLRGPAAMRGLFARDQGAQKRWREYSHPRYARVVESWTGRDLAALPDAELLAGVVELLDAGTEYYTAVQTIIPIAASSEVIFTQFYDRLVRRAGDPPAPTYLLGFDSAPIRAEKSLYDLAAWVRLDPELAAELLATPSPQVLARTGPGWDEWRARFDAHLATYGHTVYNLDFRNAVPADDPGPLVDTLRFYLEGAAADPHERQRRSAEARDRHATAVQARLGPARRAVFTRLLRWAQSSAPVREDALADVGLAWPRMRQMLAELGRRRVADGTIDAPGDVFWLRRDEVLGGNGPGTNLLADRKARWRGQRRVTPPQMLPQGTVFDRFEALFPAGSADQVGDVLRGTGASDGQVTATARVLAGPEDFGRMRPGDVLVASITTPAWTTLFALASGVVTDIGGPLSHSSIVAREYGIPAVLGTNVATRRIADGQRVRVDGDAGTVTLLPDGSDAPAPAAEPVARRGVGRLAVPAVAAALAVAVWRTRRRR